MRLIDADKLKGYRLERHSESNRLIVSKSIANVPTAFDVEAVVKQIEELVECDENGCGKTFYLGQGCSACMFGKIIEIVRNGGVK